MGIRALFSLKSIFDKHASEEAKVQRGIIEKLARVGEEAIAIARTSGNYTDQTGNLRGSIGYVISYGGHVVGDAGFDPNVARETKKQRDGQTGAKEGKNLAYEMAGRHKSGYALVVVAGMYYGFYVEKRQYDVLTFTEAQARILANELLGNMFKVA